MIKLHSSADGALLYLRGKLIEAVYAYPTSGQTGSTLITTTGGRDYIVREGLDVVIDRIEDDR